MSVAVEGQSLCLAQSVGEAPAWNQLKEPAGPSASSLLCRIPGGSHSELM